MCKLPPTWASRDRPSCATAQLYAASVTAGVPQYPPSPVHTGQDPSFGAIMNRAVLIVVQAVLAAVYLAALLVPYEPDERRPGTRLGGPLAAEQDTDWSFRSPGRMQIFVETATWYGVPHSVTTTSWIVDGDLYVPCNACATKRWPKNVARLEPGRAAQGRRRDLRAAGGTDRGRCRAAAAIRGTHRPAGAAGTVGVSDGGALRAMPGRLAPRASWSFPGRRPSERRPPALDAIPRSGCARQTAKGDTRMQTLPIFMVSRGPR